MVLSIKFTTQNIYISEQNVSGKTIKVYKTFTADMPEGAYQRGVIIDTVAVSDKLREVLRENNVRTKKAMAVIHAVDIMQKELSLPAAGILQTRGMVENELRKSDFLKNDYFVDFISQGNSSRQQKSEMQSVPTFLIPKTLIQNYMQTLQRAGLIPVKLKPFRDTVDKLVHLLDLEESSEAGILIYAEQNMAEICMAGGGIKEIYRSIQKEEEEMIEENIYILSTHQNLQKSEDPQQFMLNSLNENISKLVQAQQQSIRGFQPVKILLYGEMAQSADFLEKLAEGTGIPVEKCKVPSKYLKISGHANLRSNLELAAVDGSRLLGEKKELNFARQYREQRSGYITTRDRIPVLVMLILLFITVAAGSSAKILDLYHQKEIREYEEQIAEVITSREYNENLIKQGMLERYMAYNNICSQYIETLENTRRLESDIFRKLDELKPEQVTIYTYLFDNHAFILNCRTPDQDAPAAYAEKVTASEEFVQVEYTGFQQENGIEGEAYYSFTLKCTLE